MAIELRSTRLDMLPLAQFASARQPALSASRRKERLNWPLLPISHILPPRRVRSRDLAPSRWETLEKQYRAGQCGWGKLQLEILRVTGRSQPRRIIRPSASLPSLCSQIPVRRRKCLFWVTCGRRHGRSFFGVAAALVECGHVSGLLMRRGWPLALMLYADRVRNTDFAILRPIVLTSPMDGSPQCVLLSRNHPRALLMPQSRRRPQHH